MVCLLIDRILNLGTMLIVNDIGIATLETKNPYIWPADSVFNYLCIIWAIKNYLFLFHEC